MRSTQTRCVELSLATTFDLLSCSSETPYTGRYGDGASWLTDNGAQGSRCGDWGQLHVLSGLRQPSASLPRLLGGKWGATGQRACMTSS